MDLELLYVDLELLAGPGDAGRRDEWDRSRDASEEDKIRGVS
jgi:hypothetical protein